MENETDKDDDTVQTLMHCLKSHSHVIRQSALELLCSPLFSLMTSREAVKRCLTAELVPLTIQGVRERVLRIGRLSLAVEDGNQSAAKACILWLLGE